jgi:hypothetical protein
VSHPDGLIVHRVPVPATVEDPVTTILSSVGLKLETVPVIFKPLEVSATTCLPSVNVDPFVNTKLLKLMG